MNIKTKIKELDRPDYYHLSIKNYKQVIEGSFSREEIRHLIEILDNAISVGLK